MTSSVIDPQPAVRHSHGIVDALFAIYTKLFFGTRTTPGLADGVRTVAEWHERIHEAYRAEKFVVSITRKYGIMALDKLFTLSIYMLH